MYYAKGPVFPLWTPVDGASGERLCIPRDEVQVVSGSPLDAARGRGYRGQVRWNGRLYSVTGISCGLPHCNCDARIDLVKETK